MVNPPWLEELREKLVGQGLPPLYIERLVQELSDHYDDILQEGLSMEPERSKADERMGQPSHLAQVAASEYSMHTPLYCHKQKTPFVWFYGLCCLPLVFIGLWSLWLDETQVALVLCGSGLSFALLALCFRQLTVCDEGESLSIRFGPLPLFRTKIAYRDIQKVEVGEIPFIGPLSHRGSKWWTLGGRAYVAIQRPNALACVGTDDAANLAVFLQRKMSRCQSGQQPSA